LGTYFDLAIGSCVTAEGYASGAVSDGSLNLAVSFGIAFAHAVNSGGLIYSVPWFLSAGELHLAQWRLLMGSECALIWEQK
jgi:glycerol uptake facilitator-like aquaporin